jgi:hypothetical protein
MSDLVKVVVSQLVVTLVIGGVLQFATVQVLAERIEGVKPMIANVDTKADEAKQLAQEAHRRINFFHGGG